MNLVDRAKNIILTPASEWPVIETEATDVVGLYRNYIMYLAAIPPIAGFLGGLLFGYSAGPITVRIGFFSGIAQAFVQYALALAMIYVVSLAVSYIAPNFGGKRDDLQALKLTAYSYTPFWIAGIFALLPGLRFLAIVGLYGLYVFYLGAPRMLKIPEHQAAAFTAVVVVVTLVIGAVLAFLLQAVLPRPGFGIF